MKSNGMKTWQGRALVLMLALSAGFAAVRGASAQQQDGGGHSQYAGMEHIGGEVTAVAGAMVTVKTETGESRQIVTTANTRIMKGRGVAAKVADLKVGDGVMAVGQLDGPGGTMHAAMLFATDASQLKAMKENLGKTYIAGKVTAIDSGNATITVERPDHVSQTIGLDETTSFRRGGRGLGMTGEAGTGGAPGAAVTPAQSGESITLADIKIGDNLRGTGALKNGVFVPAQLIVLPAGAGQGLRHSNPATPPPA